MNAADGVKDAARRSPNESAVPKETLIYSKLKQKGNAASPNEALLNKFSGKNF